jgi:hypothetical protein
MITTRYTVQACCGKTNVIFKLDRSIDLKLLNFLVDKGFVEEANFTKVGMLYVNNSEFTLTGAFGGDKLQAKCKLKDCAQKLDELEGIFLQME